MVSVLLYVLYKQLHALKFIQISMLNFVLYGNNW